MRDGTSRLRAKSVAFGAPNTQLVHPSAGLNSGVVSRFPSPVVENPSMRPPGQSRCADGCVGPDPRKNGVRVRDQLQ